MKSLKDFVQNLPIIGDLARFFYRFVTALKYFFLPLKYFIIWLFTSKEITNYTYHLTSMNKQYLAALIADITGSSFSQIESYINELENDQDLRRHIQNETNRKAKKGIADKVARYGRRAGWYAFIRAVKPHIVVETGVDKGLGSCVITSALIKNESEGFSGYYIGTDINPDAGYLLSGEYCKYGEIVYGDSISTLKVINKTIDIFINDSDHSPEYEENEYQTVSNNLNPNAILLGDNSHNTDKRFNFAQSTGRHFIFFHEVPDKHWYPGAGIGIAFRR